MLIPLICFKIIVVKGNHLVRNYTNVKTGLFSAKFALGANDNLGSLTAYISNFAKRFFEPTSIDLKIHTANSIDTHKEKFVHADKRRMIYLTSKEILNNIVKHAEAKSTTIELVLDDVSNFSIKITDDGKGININENHTGNGLKNIAENLKHINGSYHYGTSNNGTEFLVSVKI